MQSLSPAVGLTQGDVGRIGQARQRFMVFIQRLSKGRDGFLNGRFLTVGSVSRSKNNTRKSGNRDRGLCQFFHL